ncbi:hypothetical protein GCM10010272_51140 [Streptomyces lateritius]|nr:hypothetical protein GCM10010272_51140 [Streptomyces lateritius]
MVSNAQSVPDGGFGCPAVRDVSGGEDPYGPDKKARMDLNRLCVGHSAQGGAGETAPPRND